MTEFSERKPLLTIEQKAALEELAIALNEKMVTSGQDSANSAFNLGCSVGLVPALILVILTLLITKGSWIATALISGLMIIGLLAFANLSAYISRSRAYECIYLQEIIPEIEGELQKIGVDHFTFEVIVKETIPAGAPLRAYISPGQIDDTPTE